MTKREAIRECKKLWAEIKKSGLSKYRFLKTDDGAVWKGKKYMYDCPLCSYSRLSPDDDGEGCDNCPLGVDCVDLGFDENPPSPKFFEAVTNLKVHG